MSVAEKFHSRSTTSRHFLSLTVCVCGASNINFGRHIIEVKYNRRILIGTDKRWLGLLNIVQL